MIQNSILNVQLSNSQLNKLKSGIKNGTEATLKLSLNFAVDSYNKNNLPYKLLLFIAQASKLCKAFANNSSANTKLSKYQLHKGNGTGDFRVDF